MTPAVSLYTQDFGALQIAFAAGLILVSLVLSKFLKLDLEKDFFVAALRTTIQLIAVGFVLRLIFGAESLFVNLTAVSVMTLAAAQAVLSRLKKRSIGLFFVTLVAVLVGVWPVGFLCLAIVFPETAFYHSSFFIPFMGVLLGNALSAVSLNLIGLEIIRSENLHEIETFMALGARPLEACRRLYRNLLRQALTPILNGMTIVGIVSLPGVMAGQLLGGIDPLIAGRMQILIMFVILLSSMLGAMAATAFYHSFMMPRWLVKRAVFWAFPQSDGASLALVGPSGSGKTRLLKSMVGIDDISVRDEMWSRSPVYPLSEASQCSYYLHQKPHFIPGTVEENLRWPFQFQIHSGRNFDLNYASKLFEMLGLKSEFLVSSATTLSGGEAQLVHLVRVLLLNPEHLYLDEPTASLDSHRTQLAEAMICGWLNERHTRRMVVVTHNAEQRSRLCQSVVFVRDGKLAYS